MATATAKDQFIEDVRSYIDAGERLIDCVTAFNEMNAAALEDLESGMTLTESFAKRDSAGWSRQVNSMLEGFEDCRRKTRESAAVALVGEGHTAASVASAFGTTRQWASRILKAARAAPDNPDPATSGVGQVPTPGPEAHPD